MAHGSSGISVRTGPGTPTPVTHTLFFSDTKSSNSLIPFLSFRSSEVRTWCRGWLGKGSGERHRDLDFVPKPEGVCQGPWHLRRGPTTWGGTGAEAGGPTQPAPGGEDLWETCSWGPSAHARLTCSLTLPCRLCSPEHLLLLQPLQKVLLQRLVPRGVERSRGTSHSAGFPRTLLVPPHASRPTDHVVGGSGGNEFECCHGLTGAQSSCCHLAHSLVLPNTSGGLGWGAGPWEAVVRCE